MVVRGWILTFAIAVTSLVSSAQTNVHPDPGFPFFDFLRSVARPTALAETRAPLYVKFLSFAVQATGEVVVTRVAVGSGHGIEFDAPEGTRAIAHVHHKFMRQVPVLEDYEVVERGLPNFVINADGSTVWELKIVDGRKLYRYVLPASAGEWQDFANLRPTEELLVRTSLSKKDRAVVARDVRGWHDAQHRACRYKQVFAVEVVEIDGDSTEERWTVEACEQRQVTYSVLLIRDGDTLIDTISNIADDDR